MRPRSLAALIFVLGGVLRVIFHALPTPIAWDASVYIGMAKAIVTSGGLWEPLRPLVWPLILAPFAAFDLVLVAHVLQFVIGMGVLWLVYAIAKDAFDEKTGLWALAFVALAPILLFYEHQLLTEQPAVFFALLAVLFLQKNRMVLTGLFASLAFLTKFPEGLMVVAIGGALVFTTRNVSEFVKDTLRATAGFCVPFIPFLILNWVLYKNPLASLEAANTVIATSGLWLYREAPLFYLTTLVEQNIFFVFALPGALLALRRNRTLLTIVFSSVLLLAYLMYLPHKEVRFLPLVLPFLAILAARGWTILEHYQSGKLRHAFIWIALILVAVFCAQTVRWGHYYATYEGERNPVFWENLYPRAAHGQALIVTSDPRVTLFTDEKIIPLYYPLFPQNLTEGLLALEGAHTLLFSPCDTPCAPTDAMCQANLAEFARIVNDTWTLQESTTGACPAMLYVRP